jgi:hypothetical protein
MIGRGSRVGVGEGSRRHGESRLACIDYNHHTSCLRMSRLTNLSGPWRGLLIA